MLDCGVDSILTRQDIANQLKLNRRFQSLNIQNAKYSNQTDSRLVNFKISSWHHPSHMKITKAWVITNLCTPHNSYDPEELQNHCQHLHRMYLPTFKPTDVTILISADSPCLLIHENFEAAKNNEPYAVYTKLGWVLIGGKGNNPTKAIAKNFSAKRKL